MLRSCSEMASIPVIYKRVDEKILVKECLSGNRKAQQQLYELHAAKMLGVCYRYAHSLEDAEDCLQEGFVKVFTSLGQYRAEGSLEGWIRRIMVNTSLNHLKSNKQIFQSIDQIEDEQWHGSIELETKDLMDEIQQLPAGFRAVFNLFAIEGYSHKEIGELLSIAESTSRSQYARARAMLMKKITQKVPVKRKET